MTLHFNRDPQRAAGRPSLVVLVGAVVFLDTMFYAVVAPLLPQLSHQLHLSKLSAGVLTACYPLGTLIASLPSGVLAARAGPRFAVCTGLAMLAISTVAFGFLRTAVGLDVARFVEGIGGACSWSGGLAWIAATIGSDRRGAMIGRALSAAIGGSLLGPAVGALATVSGRPALFSFIAVIAVALIAVTRRYPDRPTSSDQGVGALLRVMRRPSVAAGIWLMTLPALASGLINVLGPLRMHSFGAGAGAIGVVFLVGAGLEAAITPLIGGLSDRRGRLVPLRGGLLLAGVLLACFTAPHSAFVQGTVIVATACALGGFWAPAMAMLSDAADAHQIDQALAAALMNLAWAGGQILGSGGGGAIAKVTDDFVPMGIAAGLCAVTLLVLLVVQARRPSGGPARAAPVAAQAPDR